MLRLGRREFDAHEPVIMAIVNRTPDSFYDQGATFLDEPALARVEQGRTCSTTRGAGSIRGSPRSPRGTGWGWCARTPGAPSRVRGRTG